MFLITGEKELGFVRFFFSFCVKMGFFTVWDKDIHKKLRYLLALRCFRHLWNHMLTAALLLFQTSLPLRDRQAECVQYSSFVERWWSNKDEKHRNKSRNGARVAKLECGAGKEEMKTLQVVWSAGAKRCLEAIKVVRGNRGSWHCKTIIWLFAVGGRATVGVEEERNETALGRAAK